jgi:hypothetical protein
MSETYGILVHQPAIAMLFTVFKNLGAIARLIILRMCENESLFAPVSHPDVGMFSRRSCKNLSLGGHPGALEWP